MRRVKSLRIGVHHANAVVWGPVYRTHLRRVAVGAARAAEEPGEEILHLLHAAIAREPLEDPLPDRSRLARALPQHVREQQAVELAHGGAAVGVRGDAEQRDGLGEARRANVGVELIGVRWS